MLVKAHGVPDESAKGLSLLSRDASGESGRRNASGLRDGDLPTVRAILQ